MLAKRSMAFSEILSGLSIDSAHMTYHLEQLGELINRTSDGKYKLSSIGIAATNLMGGVEEQTAPIIRPSKSQTILKVVTIISIVLLISALIPSSLFFYRYTSKGVWEDTFDVSIPTNQTFRYNITIAYGVPCPSCGRYAYYYEIPMPMNAPTSREEDYVVFTLEINAGCKLSIRIYDSDGNLIENRTEDNPSDYKYSLLWEIEMDGPGACIFECDCTLYWEQPYCATLSAGMRRESFVKPYYYYGIAGFLIATICPALMLVCWVLTKKYS